MPRKLLYEKCEECGGAGVIAHRVAIDVQATARARRARKGRLPVLRRPSIPPDRPVGRRHRDDHPRPRRAAAAGRGTGADKMSDNIDEPIATETAAPTVEASKPFRLFDIWCFNQWRADRWRRTTRS